MHRHGSQLLLFILLTCLLAACVQSEPLQPEQQLHQLYPGDLSMADEIRIRNGSTGELRTYTDKQQIQQWLDSIRDISFTSSPDREKGVGYLYYVYIMEQGEEKMTFDTISIGDRYFTDSHRLQSSIEKLFLLPAATSGV